MDGKPMSRRIASFFESLVIAAILLVLVQTFLEDFSVLAGWDNDRRSAILLAGFFFDLFFTIEFLIRLYYALLDRRAMNYLLRQRGWIDFMASIPLLIFSSGPWALTLVTGETLFLGIGGILNLLKVVKALRIARVLRFMRVIKLFRHLKNVTSPMAQRHVATVTSIAITVLVLSLLLFSSFGERLNLNALDSAFMDHHRKLAAELTSRTGDPAGFAQALAVLQATEDSLLIVKFRGQTLFSRHENDYYRRNFGPGDYSYALRGDLELFFDLRSSSREAAGRSLLFFALVLMTVVAYLLVYSPIFALSVSDPIHVMRRGLAESDYNLEVKIPERYREDDLFELAALYNEKYLPLKDRSGPSADAPLLDLGSTAIDALLEEESSP
jgi:hypothetical protein